ncbi:hypothetical protein ACWED2_30010 [Amycolatopsis sp. NPDC005003]
MSTPWQDDRVPEEPADGDWEEPYGGRPPGDPFPPKPELDSEDGPPPRRGGPTG